MVHMSEVRKSNLTKVILAKGMERWGGCGNSLGVQGSRTARTERRSKDLCLGVKTEVSWDLLKFPMGMV